MKLFEWFFTHKKVEAKQEIEPQIKNVIDDKTTQVVDDLPVGYYQASMDSYGVGRTVTNQEEVIKSIITKYRRMEMVYEVDDAVNTIVNEFIVPDVDGNAIVNIDLKNCEIPDGLKDKIIKAFEKILNKLNFNKEAYDIVRKWYVDGRIHYNIVIDKENQKKGIQKLIYVDGMDIFLQKEMKKPNEYKYYYKFYNRDTKQNYEIHPDIIVYCGSNKFDRIDGVNPVEVSYLHKAFKPMNNLKNIEDSIVIYRLVRASEKRVFTVNTGMLNKQAAEEYMRKLVDKFKNRLVYDTASGEVIVYKDNHSMVEDFWFAENAQGKGTKVSILEGGKGLKDLDDLYYFADKFYDALQIPQSRRNTEKNQDMSMFSTNAEIHRDEIIFFKMIQRMRKQFSNLFLELLKRELIWTKVMDKNDFNDLKSNIFFNFNNDNLYEEMKETAIMNSRLNTLTMIQPYIGKYFTDYEIAYNVLKFSEEEWDEKQKDFKKNKAKYDKLMYGNEMGMNPQANPYNNNINFGKNPIVKDEDEENKDEDEEDEDEEK
jgi:hypothetical protein